MQKVKSFLNGDTQNVHNNAHRVHVSLCVDLSSLELIIDLSFASVNIYLPRSINLDVHLNRSQYLLSVYLFPLLLILLKAFIYSYKACWLGARPAREERPLFTHRGQSLGHRGQKPRVAWLQPRQGTACPHPVDGTWLIFKHQQCRGLWWG